MKGEPPFPAVVMAHGTSATISMVADLYAEVFAEAGVSALLYDHRNLGVSGGEPRQEISPWVQSRGYRDAITFASTIKDHDPNVLPGMQAEAAHIYERLIKEQPPETAGRSDGRRTA